MAHWCAISVQHVWVIIQVACHYPHSIHTVSLALCVHTVYLCAGDLMIDVDWEMVPPNSSADDEALDVLASTSWGLAVLDAEVGDVHAPGGAWEVHST